MKKTADQITLQPVHIKVYKYIIAYMEKNIVPPEMEEISKGIKVTIRHTYRTVEDLCTLGYLEKTRYQRRSIKVLKPLQ